MRISTTAFAAEFEQAAAASKVEDQALADGHLHHAAQDAVIDRYGIAGVDLIFDYQNDLYAVYEDGHRPPFVVFH